MATEVYVMTVQEQNALDAGFSAAFGGKPEGYFSAPGRTEIGGNHTDHQRGRVLAGAVNLHTLAAVRKNGSREIRVRSRGYPLCIVSLDCLEPAPEEKNTTAALVRGVAAWFVRRGCPVGGFDAYVESTVLSGSGLSSSAAFEVLLGTVLSGLFGAEKFTPQEVALAGQYAENVYFGKPCGLMDQMASAVGNLVAMDFRDREQPVVEAVNFDFSTSGHALCIVDTHASHAGLTDEYAAIPEEMGAIAGYFGQEVLADVEEDAFYGSLPELRSLCGDRAVLRAIHFYDENRRVAQEVQALKRGDFPAFLELVKESGRSSWMYLQNVTPVGATAQQDVAAALALCSHLLGNRGAFRVHGGGFAGTVQAFVPFDILEAFRAGIDAVLGQGSCRILTIRSQGGVAAGNAR